jgi:condensin complex subunit 2
MTGQESKAPTDPSEARTFDSVITGLQNSYPEEKMEEISTSFCFICLLHLANEQGLKIEVGESEGRDAEKERKVGDLWGLKVCFSASTFKPPAR